MSSEPLNGQAGLPSNRRWRPWIPLAVLVIVGLLLIPAVHWRLIGWAKGEAFYQGRPTSWWERAVVRWQKNVRREAVPSILQDTDPETIPVHIELSQSSNYNVRSQATVSLRGAFEPRRAVSILIRVLDDKRPDIRETAAQALGNMGDKAREAIPALKARLKDDNEAVRKKAAEALQMIDPTAVD
jgi:HEAT repeat protein